jgi:hypothetical protein
VDAGSETVVAIVGKDGSTGPGQVSSRPSHHRRSVQRREHLISDHSARQHRTRQQQVHLGHGHQSRKRARQPSARFLHRSDRLGRATRAVHGLRRFPPRE